MSQSENIADLYTEVFTDDDRQQNEKDVGYSHNKKQQGKEKRRNQNDEVKGRKIGYFYKMLEKSAQNSDQQQKYTQKQK